MNGARLSEHSCCSFAVRCHSRRRTGGGTQLGLLKQAGQRSTNFMLLQSIRPLLFAQALRRTLHHSRRECCRTPTAATAPLARAAQAERQLSNTPLIDFRGATCLKTHYEPRHRCCRGHAGQRLSCRRAAALCRRPHRGQTLHLMQIGFRAASTLPTVLSGLFYLGLEARKGGVRRTCLLFAPSPRLAVTLLAPIADDNLRCGLAATSRAQVRPGAVWTAAPAAHRLCHASLPPRMAAKLPVMNPAGTAPTTWPAAAEAGSGSGIRPAACCAAGSAAGSKPNTRCKQRG